MVERTIRDKKQGTGGSPGRRVNLRETVGIVPDSFPTCGRFGRSCKRSGPRVRCLTCYPHVRNCSGFGFALRARLITVAAWAGRFPTLSPYLAQTSPVYLGRRAVGGRSECGQPSALPRWSKIAKFFTNVPLARKMADVLSWLWRARNSSGCGNARDGGKPDGKWGSAYLGRKPNRSQPRTSTRWIRLVHENTPGSRPDVRQ
jgi:hypothetical protein